MILLEDRLTRQVDDVVGKGIDGDLERAHFMEWRNAVADLRKTDKEINIAFRERVKGMSPARRNEEYHSKFWPERAARWEEIRQAEKTGLSMMQGDQRAAQVFTPVEPVFKIEKVDNEWFTYKNGEQVNVFGSEAMAKEWVRMQEVGSEKIIEELSISKLREVDPGVPNIEHCHNPQAARSGE